MTRDIYSEQETYFLSSDISLIHSTFYYTAVYSRNLTLSLATIISWRHCIMVHLVSVVWSGTELSGLLHILLIASHWMFRNIFFIT